MRYQTIALIGGTGFIGRQIAAELGRRRYRIRVLTRRRERNRHLLVIPTLEQVEADVHSSSALSAALAGCDAVVNLVGILKGRDHAGESFQDAHARLPSVVAEAARFNRIERLLHMSALAAAPDAPSEYLRSKAAGEEAAFASGLAVTSFRPSVVFGPEDSFVNLFASLLRMSPLVFPLACPDARFAPVYVGDVARAFADCLENDASIGERYELCGPRSYTLRELVEYIARVQGLKRIVVPLPDLLARLQARVAELVPGLPLSMDSYRSMQVPSVCTDDGLGRLGIRPSSLESVVPGYLGGRSARGRYVKLRSSAGRETFPGGSY